MHTYHMISICILFLCVFCNGFVLQGGADKQDKSAVSGAAATGMYYNSKNIHRTKWLFYLANYSTMHPTKNRINHCSCLVNYIIEGKLVASASTRVATSRLQMIVAKKHQKDPRPPYLFRKKFTC